MNENAPFWQELRNTLMLRGDSWKQVIEGLPSKIDAAEVKSKLQSAYQLAHCNMQGVALLAGSPQYATPDPEILIKYLTVDYLTPESIVLQWTYQFLILEGLAKAMTDTNSNASVADWPPMILDMFVMGLHFMVYMAALLCLMEEEKLFPFLVDFVGYQSLVRSRVRQTTVNLYAKAQDYGESFRRHGVLGLLPRLWDKIARYTQLKSEDRLPNFESKADSARDLLGYSVIAWSLILEIPAANNIQKKTVEIER